MNSYQIFKHPSGKVEAVKQGWSWPAFFFNIIWAMFKKLWLVAVGATIASVGLVAASITLLNGYGSLGDMGVVLYYVSPWIISIIFGVMGNSWRKSNLLSKGYVFRGIVNHFSPYEAAERFLKDEKQANTN